MEGDGIEGGVFGSSPLKVHVVSYRHVPNVLGDFFLIVKVQDL
jgi:hypothetical protein